MTDTWETTGLCRLDRPYTLYCTTYQDLAVLTAGGAKGSDLQASTDGLGFWRIDLAGCFSFSGPETEMRLHILHVCLKDRNKSFRGAGYPFFPNVVHINIHTLWF